MFEHAFSTVVYRNRFYKAGTHRTLNPGVEHVQALAACLCTSSDLSKIEEEMSGYAPVPKNCSNHTNLERIILVLLLRRPNGTERKICRDYINLFLHVIVFRFLPQAITLTGVRKLEWHIDMRRLYT